jgi:NAD(P)H-hydrate epimerase
MGAGIVHMLVPAGLLSAYETLVPFAVKTGIGDQSDTFFNKKHLGPVLEKLATKKGVLVLGPGAGTHPETTAFFADVLTENTYPAIADADALLAAASLENRANLLLTPHSGELSRLTAQSASTDTERAAATRSLVEKTGTTVLAKGNRSFLMAPGQKPVVIDYDTSMFTRAGFGDVLAGAIAPYFVQHHNAWEAALSGAFEMKRIAEYTARLEYLTPDDILWQ